MKSLSYKAQLLLNFSLIFVCFALILLGFQYYREVESRKALLETRLESYADIIERQTQQDSAFALAPLRTVLPQDLRITIISKEGQVNYESGNEDLPNISNHKERPEVKAALEKGFGIDIRESETLQKPYFYYAKVYPNYVIRVALPYNAEIKNFMHVSNIFLWFTLLIFPIVIVALIYISGRFGRAVAGLQYFIDSAERGLMNYDNISFPNNELGDIASKVLKMYQELEKKTQQVGLERERLMKHFHHFEEGIAIFSAQRQKVYSNPRFLQYLNTILDITTSSVNAIWSEREFKPIQEFLDQQQNQNIWNAETSVYRDTLSVGGAHYAVQVVVYSDRSFEISLSDVTKAEKNRLLKQQMSHNISHELRTPVSSIRGFLETLITCENLSAERRKDFLQRALLQVERLSDLIRDVALISKIEEAAATLPRENVDLRLLVGETIEELQSDLDKQEMSVLVDFPEEMTICGNYSLLHSIFRNLLENSVRYAGQGTRVEISCYKKNAEFLFFRYFNNGEQIPEEHLPRLFERFYRITEGRTRDCGGTGLGLSIVKNAVSFHSGDIIVKNLLDQGVEFLFTLKRGK